MKIQLISGYRFKEDIGMRNVTVEGSDTIPGDELPSVASCLKDLINKHICCVDQVAADA